MRLSWNITKNLQLGAVMTLECNVRCRTMFRDTGPARPVRPPAARAATNRLRHG